MVPCLSLLLRRQPNKIKKKLKKLTNQQCYSVVNPATNSEAFSIKGKRLVCITKQVTPNF